MRQNDKSEDVLKKILDEIYRHNQNSLPDRRSSVEGKDYCSVHSKVGIMYQAIYGPDNKPEEGLLHISKENARYISTLNETITKLTWFIVIAGLSAVGTFMIQIAKFIVKQ